MELSRYLWAQVAHRRHRLAALGAGVVVASVGFVLLTSAVATTELQVTGTIAENFRPAYDILVRPGDSFTALEREQRLVRANYLSGLTGGITFKDYREIKRIGGVEVAAPIANIGYMMPFTIVTPRINQFLSEDGVQLYRLEYSWKANGGLSTYPVASNYVYYTRRNPLADRQFLQEVLPSGKELPVCTGIYKGLPPSDDTQPFDLKSDSGITCFSELTPRIAYSGSRDLGRLAPGSVTGTANAFLPVFVAAIDPVQESKLIALEDALVGGRLLRQGEGPSLLRINSRTRYRVVPILASTRSFVDEKLVVSVRRLELESVGSLPHTLASNKAYDSIKSLPGRIVGTRVFRASGQYQTMVKHLSASVAKGNSGPYSGFGNGYWTAGPVEYRVLDGERVEPLEVRNPRSDFQNSLYGGGWAPHQNLDVQFRKLEFHQGSQDFQGSIYGTPQMQVVGSLDPEKLPGFSPLSRVPLETYYPPSVRPADPAARKAIGDRLLPTQNIGGYISQPPLMLTTLQGLKAFIDPDNFNGADDRAPISVIRIRVANVTGPDPVSRERIKRVATAVHARTGLSVDITAGSSPRDLVVELPPGDYGQPALSVKEGWVEKGVAVRFLEAVDTKSLILFVLVLVACSLFLVNASLASVKTRRVEIGVLQCVGWSQADIFRTLLYELALVGMGAGVIGVSLAAVIAWLLSLTLAPLQLLLVLPISLLLMIIAGWFPARFAARLTPMDAVAPLRQKGKRRHPVVGFKSMAVTNLLRIPSRTLLGCSGLVIGVASLTALIALNLGFQRTLVGTLLGNAISIEIRGVDFLSAVLVMLLGVLSVADVLYVNQKQREPEVAALRTLGWGFGDLARVVVYEGAAMGVLGSVFGALIGLLGVSLVQGIPVGPMLWASALACLGGVLGTIVASSVPAIRAASQIPHEALAEE